MNDERYRALLIGNWEYIDPDKVLLPLNGPPNDLVVIREALTHPEYGLFRDQDITVEANITSQEMGRRLHSFVQGGRPTDRLLIYFSGHGERLGRQQLGLCGVDVEYSQREVDAFDADRLRQWIKTYNTSSSTVVILDCCYAGQYKSGFNEDILAESFGTGTAVLSSGGNEPSRDGDHQDDPSPFTAALARILTDPDVLSGESGYVNTEDVYRALTSFEPKLLPPPRRNLQAQGSIPLARRARAEQEAADRMTLRGYDKHLTVETIDLVFRDGAVTTAPKSADEPAGDLTLLDPNRQAAIRRLATLADTLAHSADYATDPRWRHAVRKAWQCIGANLYDSAFPPSLQEKIASYSADSGGRLFKIRLRYEDEAARRLERYPWEYIQARPGPGTVPPEGDSPVQSASLPLALRPGLLVERVSGEGLQPSDRTARRRTGLKPNVGLLNALPEPFSRLALRTERELEAIPGLDLLVRFHGGEATWWKLLDGLSSQLSHLVLFAPIRRIRDGSAQIGFAHPSADADWVPVDRLVRELRDQRPLESLTVVTFPVAPGHDVIRGTFQIAQALNLSGIRPVVFVCHLPGFERSAEQYDSAGPQTFPGLLLHALSEGKPLDRSVHYARDRVMRRNAADFEALFGVPGYYSELQPAATPVAATSIGAATGSGWRMTAGKPRGVR
ncbi:caspase family protein [Jidongwangia harbinensis]|uniref:caspase family protein n=1 Tax=Jidongwangia harbinensis TaxID=2878561 RepID=UPI001CD93411|nr:caspase family protein [Jidongwangia harbinensis]MCA2218036.1 caspase family protein [Jidongwangia harbinensis]